MGNLFRSATTPIYIIFTSDHREMGGSHHLAGTSALSPAKRRRPLIDLKNDPGETKNPIDNPEYRAKADELRAIMQKELAARNYTFAKPKIKNCLTGFGEK